MYAIIETGGKQYRVAKDTIIEVEKLDAKEPADIIFDNVLLVADKDDIRIGEPYLKDIRVVAHAIRDFKNKKVISFKYRRRKSSKTRKGHRQQLVRVKINKIEVGAHSRSEENTTELQSQSHLVF